MKYKIYYKSTGFITGILPENDLSNQTNYESAIDYDSVVDLESDLTDQVIFFSCKIEGGRIVEKESDERKNLRETKKARVQRSQESAWRRRGQESEHGGCQSRLGGKSSVHWEP